MKAINLEKYQTNENFKTKYKNLKLKSEVKVFNPEKDI